MILFKNNFYCFREVYLIIVLNLQFNIYIDIIALIEKQFETYPSYREGKLTFERGIYMFFKILKTIEKIAIACGANRWDVACYTGKANFWYYWIFRHEYLMKQLAEQDKIDAMAEAMVAELDEEELKMMGIH